MKNLIKVWWHCLWRMTGKHRMTKMTEFKGKSWWCCECGYNDLSKFSWIISKE